MGPALENFEWTAISQLLPDFQFYAHQCKRQRCVARHVPRVKDQGKQQLTHLQASSMTRVRKVWHRKGVKLPVVWHNSRRTEMVLWYAERYVIWSCAIWKTKQNPYCLTFPQGKFQWLTNSFSCLTAWTFVGKLRKGRTWCRFLGVVWKWGMTW